MQEVILNLGVGVNWPTGGNMQLFLGNPGDYAWGREGLDAIVTQLLNQMDGTGNSIRLQFRGEWKYKGYSRSASAVERCDRRFACGGGEPTAGGRQAAVLCVLGGFHVEGVCTTAALPAYLPRKLHKTLA